MQAQLTTSADTSILDGEPVIYNVVIEDSSGGAITYNPVNGEFTLEEGVYFVTWTQSTDGAGPSTEVVFELQLNGAPVAQSSSLGLTGLLTGSALVNVVIAPGVLRLINATGQDVFLGQTAVQGNIVIFKVGP